MSKYVEYIQCVGKATRELRGGSVHLQEIRPVNQRALIHFSSRASYTHAALDACFVSQLAAVPRQHCPRRSSSKLHGRISMYVCMYVCMLCMSCVARFAHPRKHPTQHLELAGGNCGLNLGVSIYIISIHPSIYLRARCTRPVEVRSLDSEMSSRLRRQGSHHWTAQHTIRS